MNFGRIAPTVVIACGAVASSAMASVGEFRVLPYLQSPTTEGMTINWFTIANAPGTLSISGGDLSEPVVLTSTPSLTPVLDYQIAAELNAGGSFSFASTAIFESAGVPARNFKHSLVVTGLSAGVEYTYSVQQGGSVYTNTFRTAPLATDARPLRLAVLSDSETLVSGRTRFREWARTTPQAPGSTGRPAGTGPGRDQYLVTETRGYQANIAQIEARDPDVVVMPGDLIEGTGAEQQRRWDEFWRHNAGQYDDLLSARPLVAAIGNNCIFNGIGAGETGAGGPSTNQLISYARQQWSAYFDWPSNGTPAFQDLYYRQDYGPITIITLCSVKATEEVNSRVAPPQGQGISANFPSNRDTNRAWFSTPYAPGDIPDFNVGTTQWSWAVAELAAARAAGQIIFVQWHHTPFSRGIHGSSVTSTQSGEAMRIYAPLMDEFRVAAVFTGHSEVAEMSRFDLDGDGYAVHLWDVGAAGDGLRGVEDAPGSVASAITNWRNNPLNPEGQAFTMNPFHVWSADQSEPELWNGNQLIRGGKHYGFLEVNITPLGVGDSGSPEFRVRFDNYQNFPLNAGDASFTVTGFELRRTLNRVELTGPANNLRPSCNLADFNADGVTDFFDFLDFAQAFNVQDAAADFNADGVIDFFDYLDFADRFAASC
ncbi:MAG: metallophosphoesterase [Planctomycetota bacterium]|nr:metallophosphoesterase [Planctomycetota bacterium]